MLVNTFPYWKCCADASWAAEWVCFGCSQLKLSLCSQESVAGFLKYVCIPASGRLSWRRSVERWRILVQPWYNGDLFVPCVCGLTTWMCLICKLWRQLLSGGKLKADPTLLVKRAVKPDSATVKNVAHIIIFRSLADTIPFSVSDMPLCFYSLKSFRITSIFHQVSMFGKYLHSAFWKFIM